MTRDFNDPQYKEWRIKVYKRDKFKCRKCKARKGLQAHHIRTWSDAPELRFVLSNGITLCKKCHESMRGNEDAWEKLCRGLLSEHFVSIQWRLRNMKDE